MGLSYLHVDGGDGAFGQIRYKTWELTFDNSYPTGGELLDLSQIGLSNLLGGNYIGAKNATSAGIIPVVDYDDKKLLAMRVTAVGTVAAPIFTGSALAAHRHSLFVATGAIDATGARVNAATNSFAMNNAAATIAGIAAASGSAGGVVDITGGTPAGTNSAPAFTGTDASLVEVANAADLSLVIVRFMFYGN